MVNKIVRLIVILIGLQITISCTSDKNNIARERVSFDFDWKFYLGDDATASQTAFDDSEWRELDVPHDWSIEGAYDEANPAGKAGGFLPAGTGWYRKTFEIDELEDANYFIEFDGVYMNSDVYINGTHVGNRPYGYISFSYDLTPYLKVGENIIAVRVDNSQVPSGRWYTGSGIYRHVWLTKTSKVYVPQWGTSITTPQVSKEKALVQIEGDIQNTSKIPSEIKVENLIFNSGKELVDSISSIIHVEENGTFKQSLEVENPKLWSPDSPSMYTMITKLYQGDALMDSYETAFGIRSIEVRGSKGFFLNGEPIKFKGLSNHHDAGPVGAAVPNDVLYSRLKLVKEMGCNALRTTHNPFAPEFYAMCDSLGIMVMDEAFDGWFVKKAAYDYGLYFADWWKRDLEDFIKRDRNHPSVVMWSIGNEVRGFTPEEQKEVVAYLKSIDDTRTVTQGGGYTAPYIDVAGFNGHGEMRGALEKYHEANPDQAIIGTEITHTLQTRGVYRTRTWYRTKDNPAPWEKPHQFKKLEPKVFKIPHLKEKEVFDGITKKYQSSYDNSIVRIGVRDDWNRVEEKDYYLGNFRWTGFDYIGESFGWPARTANFGIIDLAGFPKDHYYLYQSLWSDKPMVHLLPHWTHPGKEGVEIPVVVYTNCESAELFLNDISLGEKEMTSDRQLVWNVPYERGALRVVAKNKGKVVSEKEYRTAAEAMVVKMEANKTEISANKTDVVSLEVSIVDEFGNILPHANDLVNFEITGPAKLLGVENGDILDLSPHKVPSRKVFNGKCLLLIQALEEAGTIEIKATSGNLGVAVVEITSI